MKRRAVTALSLIAALTACGASDGPSTAVSSPKPTAVPSSVPDVDVTLGKDDAPENPVVAYGSLWVSAHHAGTVVRLSLDSGTVLARIKTADLPGGVSAGGGLLWVTHYGPTKVLIGIDPKTNTVVRRFALPGESCCAPAFLGKTIWVTALVGDAPGVVAVDAATGHVGRRLEGADNPVTVGQQLFVSRDGQQDLADPSTGAMTPTALPAGISYGSTVPADGVIWGTRAGTAVGMAPDGAVRRTVTGPKGQRLFYGEDSTATTSGDTAWVTDGASKLWRIDSASAPLVLAATFSFDKAVSMVGDGSGGVWVALFNQSRVLHYAGKR